MNEHIQNELVYLKTKILGLHKQVEELEMMLLNGVGSEIRVNNTCLNCINWNNQRNNCKICNQVPPPYIIAMPDKCPQYDFAIPF